MINAFELLQAKDQFNTAKINLSKAKFNISFKKILDFYKGIPIKL